MVAGEEATRGVSVFQVAAGGPDANSSQFSEVIAQAYKVGVVHSRQYGSNQLVFSVVYVSRVCPLMYKVKRYNSILLIWDRIAFEVILMHAINKQNFTCVHSDY